MTIFSKLRQRIESLLGRKRTPGARFESTDIGAPSAPADGAEANAAEAAILRRLNRLASDRAPLVAGKVQVLNIESIRAHFGERWPSVADRVHDRIEAVLWRHLSAKDLFTRYGQLHYVLIFAEVAGDEAKAKAIVLGREVRRAVLGAVEGYTDITVSTAVATADGTLALERISSLDALAGFIEAEGEPVDESELPPQRIEESSHSRSGSKVAGQPSEIAAARDELRTLLRIVEERRRNGGDAGEQALSPDIRQRLAELARLLGPASAEGPNEVAPDPRGMQVVLGSLATAVPIDVSRSTVMTLLDVAAADAARRIAGAAGTSRFVGDAQGLSMGFLYDPFWSVWNKAITTYLCRVVFVKDGCHYSPRQLRFGGDALAFLASTDACVLSRAVADLDAATQGGRVNMVCVPVHYSTLSLMVRRDSYVLALHSVPEALRRYIVWEVIDAPESVPARDVRAAVSTLTPFGRLVLWSVALERRDFKGLARGGVTAVGVDLRQFRRPEEVLLPALETFAENADKCGIRCYLLGLHTLSLVTTAICAGFSYLSGNAIAPSAETAHGVVRLEAAGIYLRLLARER